MIDTAIMIAFWTIIAIAGVFVCIFTIAGAHALAQRLHHASERRAVLHKVELLRIEFEAKRAAKALAEPESI